MKQSTFTNTQVQHPNHIFKFIVLKYTLCLLLVYLQIFSSAFLFLLITQVQHPNPNQILIIYSFEIYFACCWLVFKFSLMPF